MDSNTQAILNAIQAAQDASAERHSELKLDITKRLDDHETRLRATEKDMTRVKAAGGTLAALVSTLGIGTIRSWLRG